MSEATAGNAVGEAVRAGVAADPLFLVGVPRSGTTLLYKLLCLHPDAAYISNWMRTAPAVPALALANRAYATLRRHPQDDLVRRRPGQRLCERRADGVAQAAVSQAGRG